MPGIHWMLIKFTSYDNYLAPLMLCEFLQGAIHMSAFMFIS